MTDKLKTINSQLKGSLEPAELKSDEGENVLRIVWACQEPDGTVRKATPEEAEEYNSYAD